MKTNNREKKWLTKGLMTLLILTATAASTSAQRQNLLFEDGFESGQLSSAWGREVSGSHSITIVSSPTRVGNFALRSRLRPEDDERAEVKLDRSVTWAYNAERWIGVSIYFPNDGSTNDDTSIFQMYARPTNGAWPPPPFQLQMNNGRLRMTRYGLSTSTPTIDRNQHWDLGAVPRGAWVDFVFHLVGSTGSSGIFDVWVNGERKVNYRGATVADNRTWYNKMGVYVGLGNNASRDRSLYYDEYRVGNQNATCNDVAPGAFAGSGSSRCSGSSPTPPPPPPAGTVVIDEDFNLDASFNSINLLRGGVWRVSGNRLQLNSPAPTTANTDNGNLAIYNQASVNGNFVLTANASVVSTSSQWNDFSIAFNVQDANNYYYANFSESNNSETSGIFRVSNAVVTQLSDISELITAGQNYQVRVERQNGAIRIYLNNELAGTATDSTFADGYVGFGSKNDAANFDNLRVVR